MPVVYVFLGFVFLIAIALVKWQLQDEKTYTKEEIEQMIGTIRREVALLESDRSSGKISTYEYALYGNKIAKEVEKLEEINALHLYR